MRLRRTRKTLFQQRIEKVRKLTPEEVKKAILDKSIYDYLDMRYRKSSGRRTYLNKILVGAGMRSMKGTRIGDVVKTIAKGKYGCRRPGKEKRVSFQTSLAMLESAGIVKRLRKKKKIIFKVIDKERLEKCVREGRIIWEEEV